MSQLATLAKELEPILDESGRTVDWFWPNSPMLHKRWPWLIFYRQEIPKGFYRRESITLEPKRLGIDTPESTK